MKKSLFKVFSAILVCLLFVFLTSCIRISKESAEETELKSKLLNEALSKLGKTYDEVGGFTSYADKGIVNVYESKIFLALGKTDESKSFVLSFHIFHTYKSNLSWLFIKSYLFNVDGEKFYINPSFNEIDRDNGTSYMYETYTCFPTEENLEMIQKIIESKKTILRCIGDRNIDREITDLEKIGLDKVIEAYKLCR